MEQLLLLALVLLVLAPATGDEQSASNKTPRIRCPKCSWMPTAESRWYCSFPCLCCWNTFATRGKCPLCGKQWLTTACLSCGEHSDHEAWYEKVAPDQNG
jgi:hypothetical protein